MSELESSGLLDKEPEQTSPLSPPRVPTQDPTPSTSTLDDAHMPDGSASPSTGVGPDGHEAAEANLAATIVNAVTDNQPEVPKQSGAPEQHRADAAGAAAAGSEAAEQRVLGDLEGAPTWREVLMLLMLMLACARQGRVKTRTFGNLVEGGLSACALCSCLPTTDASVWGIVCSCPVCAKPTGQTFRGIVQPKLLNSRLYGCSTGRCLLSKIVLVWF